MTSRRRRCVAEARVRLAEQRHRVGEPLEHRGDTLALVGPLGVARHALLERIPRLVGDHEIAGTDAGRGQPFGHEPAEGLVEPLEELVEQDGIALLDARWDHDDLEAASPPQTLDARRAEVAQHVRRALHVLVVGRAQHHDNVGQLVAADAAHLRHPGPTIHEHNVVARRP